MTLPDLDQLAGSTPDPAPKPPGSHGRSYAFVAVAVLALVAIVGGAIAIGTDSGGDTASGRTIRYLVPLGTGDRIDAGEDVQIIPAQLTLAVGDELVLINEDDRVHTVAGYQVRAGDTVAISYPRPGLYMNACSVNTDELVTITVVP